MTITVSLNDEDTKLMQDFAQSQGISVNELAKAIMMEMIEDKLDLQDYQKALEEYRKNPVTYTLEEIEKELGL